MPFTLGLLDTYGNMYNPLGNAILSFIEGCMALSGLICTERVHLGLSEVEGCPHVRGGPYEGFHCTYQQEGDRPS